MQERFKEMLPIDGRVFDVGSHGTWLPKIAYSAEVPPKNGDRVDCTLEFHSSATGTTRHLRLLLSHFNLAHSRFDPCNTRCYQQQIITLCSDWLRTDQPEGALHHV